ncbi:NMCC_0638 family (lipo)protein [Pleionea mediterranea]|uniref:NMCC_0638 family (lipo)protein n=1 Tax=Pleionea mediterranea TaxID=523701 RepID=UPI000D6B9909
MLRVKLWRWGGSPVSGDAAQKYLSGNAGKAWHLKNEQGRFGLTVLDNTLCSVFVHQGEPATLQNSMEA